MTNNNVNGSDTFNALPSQVELELLEALLESEDAAYPWNPADEECEIYFSELEQQFTMQDELDEELTTKSLAFITNLIAFGLRFQLTQITNVIHISRFRW